MTSIASKFTGTSKLFVSPVPPVVVSSGLFTSFKFAPVFSPLKPAILDRSMLTNQRLRPCEALLLNSIAVDGRELGGITRTYQAREFSRGRMFYSDHREPHDNSHWRKTVPLLIIMAIALSEIVLIVIDPQEFLMGEHFRFLPTSLSPQHYNTIAEWDRQKGGASYRGSRS